MDIYIFITIIVALTILILFYLSILWLIKKGSLSYKEERKLKGELYKWVEKKAKLLAKRKRLREEVEYGHLDRQEFDRWEKKIQKRIDEIDAQIDNILDRLAQPYVDVFYEKEKIGVEERERHVVMLQKKVGELAKELEKVKEEKEELEKKIGSLEYELQQARKVKFVERENPLLELFFKRYKKLVEKKEGDLKKGIVPTHPKIKELAKIGDVNGVYDFVMKNIETVDPLPIKFLLSVDEILEHRIADPLNKALFLCSIFRAMGKDAKVVMGHVGEEKKVFVECDGLVYDMVEKRVGKYPEGFEEEFRF